MILYFMIIIKINHIILFAAFAVIFFLYFLFNSHTLRFPVACEIQAKWKGTMRFSDWNIQGETFILSLLFICCLCFLIPSYSYTYTYMNEKNSITRMNIFLKTNLSGYSIRQWLAKISIHAMQITIKASKRNIKNNEYEMCMMPTNSVLFPVH